MARRCLRCPGCRHGVGFSLSLDYGTTSIYFSNGSRVDVAKIEGGSAYKQTIRSTQPIDDIFATDNHFSHVDTFDPCYDTSHPYLELQSLGDYLPPWLRGPNACTRSLIPMLDALKTAVEAYIETSLVAAEVVFPFPVSDDYFDALRSAMSSVSLQMPMSEQPPAGILAARAHGIGKKCNSAAVADRVSEQSQMNDHEPAQLILTVEYSGAALTVLLLVEECNVFEYRRVLHDTGLGADTISRTPNGTHEDLACALRRITTLPLEEGNGAQLRLISQLVLLGERADDRLLHRALEEVLRENYRDIATKHGEVYKDSIDPLFAASSGLAQDCWDRLNYPHQEAMDPSL
ncbi:MAG: hypothetical protein Q9163_006242 [Psora crenata]